MHEYPRVYSFPNRSRWPAVIFLRFAFLNGFKNILCIAVAEYDSGVLVDLALVDHRKHQQGGGQNDEHHANWMGENGFKNR